MSYCILLTYTALLSLSLPCGTLLGFPSHSGTFGGWEPLFLSSMRSSLSVLAALPHSLLLKDAVRALFQRLVSALGREFLPLLPIAVSRLLFNCVASDLVDFVPLVAQLTFRYKEAIYPMLNELMGALIGRIFECMAAEMPAEMALDTNAVCARPFFSERGGGPMMKKMEREA